MATQLGYRHLLLPGQRLARSWSARQQLVACPLLRPGADVGGGERAEDLFWFPGHVGVGGAAFMLEDRYDSVGGQIKVAVGVGRVPGIFESGEGEPTRACRGTRCRRLPHHPPAGHTRHPRRRRRRKHCGTAPSPDPFGAHRGRPDHGINLVEGVVFQFHRRPRLTIQRPAAAAQIRRHRVCSAPISRRSRTALNPRSGHPRYRAI